MSDAIVFNGPWDIALQPQKRPTELEPHQVLVEVRYTGICGTDIGIVSGQYAAKPGVIIGHETAGVVVAVGNRVTFTEVGARVAIDPTYYCGCCAMCRTGRPNHCIAKSSQEAGVSCDGAFARYYLTTERFVYPLRAGTSFEAATFSEPLSCILTALNQIRIRSDMRTVIFGAGPIGLLFAKTLASRGVRGVLVEVSAKRRAIAEQIAPTGWQSLNLDAMEGHVCDLAIETSGRAFQTAMDMLTRGGQLLQVALLSDTVPINPALFADRSLSLVGSIDSIGTFSQAVNLIEDRTVDVSDLITATLPLSRYDDAFSKVGLDLTNQTRSYDQCDAVKVLLSAS